MSREIKFRCWDKKEKIMRKNWYVIDRFMLEGRGTPFCAELADNSK